MLARRSTLTHPLAGQLDLPFLVPAFSSKGFDFHTKGRGKKKSEYSEVAYELAEFGQYPAGSVLVSAYDLHFGHFKAPDLPKNRSEDYLRNASLVFLDSGGYELSSDFDLTESRKYEYRPKDGFTERDYRKILAESRNLKLQLPLIISNFDFGTIRKPLSEQIASARLIFRENPDAISDFILKPWTKDSKMVDPERLSESDIKTLRGFDIIGVTEKDLGKNLFDRIKAIASLRYKLDSVGIDAPIHIWGGLDPISTPLFFFAGAQIFDGISWLLFSMGWLFTGNVLAY